MISFSFVLILFLLYEVISLYLNWRPSLGQRRNCLFVCWQVDIYCIQLTIIALLSLNISLVSNIWCEFSAWWCDTDDSWMHLATTCVVVCQ